MGRARELIKSQWQKLGSKAGVTGIADLVEAAGALPPALKDDVEKFFARHPVDEAKRALQKALEAMDVRRALIERERPRLSSWLAQTRA